MRALILASLAALAGAGCTIAPVRGPIALPTPASAPQSVTVDARRVQVEVAKQAMRERCGADEAVKRRGRDGASPHDYKCKERTT